MDEMPLTDHPIDAAVLAHRRDTDSVPVRHGSKLQRIEQSGGCHEPLHLRERDMSPPGGIRTPRNSRAGFVDRDKTDRVIIGAEQI